jgi:hypothetical protein
MNAERSIIRGLVPVSEVVAYIASDCYLDKRASAVYLSVSVRTLEGLPELRRYRIGKGVRYRRSELDAWMARHAEEPRRPAEKAGGLRGLLDQAKKRALEEEKNQQTVGQEI